MERIAVTSKNIRAVGYEAETSTLEVEFNYGSVYQYHSVPQEVYDSFILADSKGTFLNTNIKGSYSFTKL